MELWWLWRVSGASSRGGGGGSGGWMSNGG